MQVIDQGIWELNDILSVVPSTVNIELKRVIREMKLRELFRALLGVQDLMQQSKAKPEDIRCFAAGGRDLGRLDRDIDDLMLQHDQWQRIDDLMRRIDNNGKGKPSDLEFAWPKLNSLLLKQLDSIDDRFREGDHGGNLHRVAGQDDLSPNQIQGSSCVSALTRQRPGIGSSRSISDCLKFAGN